MRAGITLGRGRAVVAVEGENGRPVRLLDRPLADPAADDWPALAALLTDLRTAHDVRSVAVALRPPLARSKVLSLPPLREADARTLVERRVGRWFPGLDTGVIVGVKPLERRRPGRPCPMLVSVAEATLVESVHGTAARVGVPCERVVSATTAQLAAVTRRVPALRAGSSLVVTWSGEWREGVALQDGRPRSIERWGWAAPEEVPALCSRLVEAGSGETRYGQRVVVTGDPECTRVVDLMREDLQAEAAAACADRTDTQDSDILAALGAATLVEVWPLLQPPPYRRALERRDRMAMGRIVAATLAFLVLAAGLHVHGLQRELDHLTARRQAHEAAVLQAVALRGDVANVLDRLDGIARLEASLPRWSETFAALAEALPDSTYLVTVATDSGGIRVEGAAPSSALAFRALRASPLLSDVRLLASFRPERTGQLERFDLSLSRRLAAVGPTAGPATAEGGRP